MARTGNRAERIRVAVGCSRGVEMSDHQREIYQSENGDRWLLCRDDDGRVFVLYQRPQGLTVAQVLDVIEATRSGSSAKKFHAAQDLSTSCRRLWKRGWGGCWRA